MITPHSQTDPASDKSDTFFEWAQLNARPLLSGAAVLAVAAAGYWLYLQSVQIKILNAEKALSAAKQSIGAGNTALAQNDLQKLMARYPDTRAGVEAGLLEAQIAYEGGKYAEGLRILRQLPSRGSAAPIRSQVYSLIANGYAQEKRLADAAGGYEKAAKATAMPNEQAFYNAEAARTFEAAGKKTDAERLWRSLATDSVEAVAAEARVRLAELAARVESKL